MIWEKASHCPAALPPRPPADVWDPRTHIRAVHRRGLHQRLDDPGIDVEQIVARHAGLARHAGGNDQHLGALERGRQLLRASVPRHLRTQARRAGVAVAC
eukprot:361100-Chlamydomonas_euryale.AAC.29